MVQLFSRQRRLVFGTASVPIISIANIYVMEAKNIRKLQTHSQVSVIVLL